MIDPIVLKDLRSKVDEEFVQVKPNSGSIKPVHIAQAALRTFYGKYYKSRLLKRVALVCDSSGMVRGNPLEEVYKELLDLSKIDPSITEAELQSLRNLMQKTLSADKGVFVADNLADNMISFTAGSKYFLLNSGFMSEGGILIATIIKKQCPRLTQRVNQILEQADDPISSVFYPITKNEDDFIIVSDLDLETIPAFKNPSKQMKEFLDGIKESGECLAENFEKHPNPLTQLRLLNLFIIFNLIRYLTSLASFYCKENLRPVLLDFSNKSPNASSVARASETSYTQMYRSLNRFYAWAFSEKLKNYTIEELIQSPAPVYENGKSPKKAEQEELDALWNIAKKSASEKTDPEEKYLIFGETIYDMLAMQATSHPIIYLKKLGTDAGILYPPDKQHPNKRFAVSQDVIEMLMRSTVNPNSVITEEELRERLWKRFGIIIGGRSEDLARLQENNVIIQVSEDALENNFSEFAKVLESMDFAEQMADGILKIRLGGTNK